MNICFGGSFNPPSLAHKEMVLYIKEKFNPNNLIIVPCGNNYNKKDLIDFKYRYEMLKIAMKDIAIISDVEGISKNYLGTLNTLDLLSKDYSDLYFVMGADNLVTIKSWINYRELLRKYKFIVFRRDEIDIEDYVLNNLYEFKDRFTFIDGFKMNVSSTAIRNDLEGNKDMLDIGVYEYIKQNNLYKG